MRRKQPTAIRSRASASRERLDEPDTFPLSSSLSLPYADGMSHSEHPAPSPDEGLAPLQNQGVRKIPDFSQERLDNRPKRRVALPIFLFFATCLSTFWVGASHWVPEFASGIEMRKTIIAHWEWGLLYMVTVMAILFFHEMGHFIATIFYKIPASLPFFIPFPPAPLGTMGAVIAMDGHRATRRQLFDIGIAGPLAGLVVAVPALWFGIQQLDLNAPVQGLYDFDLPLLARWMVALLHPDAEPITTLHGGQLNPLLMAGWVGMLITGLNMLPISQLDGGHVIYTLFGRKAHWIARTFLITAILFVVFAGVQIWTVMLVLVTLMGVDHPPTADDRQALGPVRTVLGLASLAIPLLCFPPHGLFLHPPW